jgi:hypothetical protein
MEHLSADRLADIISTDRAASAEADLDFLEPESATMLLSDTSPQDADTELSGPPDPFQNGARGSRPAAEERYQAEPYEEKLYEAKLYVAQPYVGEPYEAELVEEQVLVELDGEQPEMAPVFSRPPVLAPPPIPLAASDHSKKGAWVGRHRRPKSLKLKVRSLSLTSVLLTVMGVLTLIVVATAVHAAS